MKTSSPRVCLLHNYRERHHTSMRLYAEQLGRTLPARGFAVEHVEVADVLPRSWQKLETLSKLDSYAGRFLVYPRRARQLQADIFHVVDHGQAYLLRHLDPARTVVTCHDVILLVLASGRLGSSRAPRLATRVLRHSVQAMRKARCVLADSEQTKADLVRLADIDPNLVRVVYLGLNGDFRPIPGARERVRQRLNLGEGPIVLHVGHTGFYKNIEGCLRVIASLRRQGVPARFVRAGPHLRPHQRALAERLGVADALIELGPVFGDALVELYGAADVLLFPSLYEGFGWPPVEAMACGTPVVTSRSGSLAEVAGEAALTAEPEDVSGLAWHVGSILGDARLAARVRERGLARAKLFTWDRMADQVVSAYETVLGARGSPSSAAAIS